MRHKARALDTQSGPAHTPAALNGASVVEIAIAPKIGFENGKAVKAQINWGEASGPMLVYALIYAGSSIDNSANMLGPEVARVVNEFTTKKYAEVKDELPAQMN